MFAGLSNWGQVVRPRSESVTVCVNRMNQITQLFRELTVVQRVWIAVIAVAIVGGLSATSHWNQERDFKPLFSGVAAENAGPLLAKLREMTVEYRLADNGTTVLVPSAKVAELEDRNGVGGVAEIGADRV